MTTAVASLRQPFGDGVRNHLRILGTDSVDGFAERIVSCHYELPEFAERLWVFTPAY